MNILSFSETRHSISTQTACFSLSRNTSILFTLLQSHFFKTLFSIILPSKLRSSKLYLSCKFRSWDPVCILLPIRATCCAYPIDWIAPIKAFCELHKSLCSLLLPLPVCSQISPHPPTPPPHRPLPLHQQLPSIHSVNNMQSAPIRQSSAMSVPHTNTPTPTVTDVSLS